MKISSSLRSKYPVLLVAGLGGLFTVVNLASGQGWTATGAPETYWRSVACSADGAKLVAIGSHPGGQGFGSPRLLPIYTSADFGVTWTQTTAPTNLWSSVASSADGTKLVAVLERANQYNDIGECINLGSIYSSADSGATWSQTSAPSNNWASVASSADGTKLVAAAYSYPDSDPSCYGDGLIYTSADSGATWTQTSAPSAFWASVASSADGTKLVVAVQKIYDSNVGGFVGGLIYSSTNAGTTWTQASAPTNYWTSVASSADGSKLVAVVLWGPIYTSMNSGVTWTQTSAPTNYWTSIAASADATKLLAASLNDSIYTSSDSGATWTQSIDPIGYFGSCVASSADGSKLVAASSLGLIYTYTSPYLGPWSFTGARSNQWMSVASSMDGMKLIAGGYSSPIYTSTNSGDTWMQATAPISNSWSVASSSDGTKLVAESDGIYTSSDSGATWRRTSAPITCCANVVSSADGSKLAAAGNVGGVGNFIYTSTDSGATWSRATSAPSTLWWQAIASSVDGTKLAAVAVYQPHLSFALIYTSTNSGATWTQTSAPSNSWTSVASSADGTKLVAAAGFDNHSPGPIYTSADSGGTWRQTSAPSSVWLSVISSADGTKLVAVDQVRIFTSTDSGATWTAVGAPAEDWRAVASSADGSKLVAITSSGPIYTLQLPIAPRTLSPRLSISPSGGSLDISWIVPSTSFVLQQSSDLTATNWTDVPTLPTLNFTNLHYEVTALPSSSSSFYRLKQQ